MSQCIAQFKAPSISVVRPHEGHLSQPKFQIIPARLIIEPVQRIYSSLGVTGVRSERTGPLSRGGYDPAQSRELFPIPQEMHWEMVMVMTGGQNLTQSYHYRLAKHPSTMSLLRGPVATFPRSRGKSLGSRLMTDGGPTRQSVLDPNYPEQSQFIPYLTFRPQRDRSDPISECQTHRPRRVETDRRSVVVDGSLVCR